MPANLRAVRHDEEIRVGSRCVALAVKLAYLVHVRPSVGLRDLAYLVGTFGDYVEIDDHGYQRQGESTDNQNA